MLRWLSVAPKDRVAHLRNGQFVHLYGPGRHWVWTGFSRTDFVTYDATLLPGVAAGDQLPAEGTGWRSANVREGFRHLLALRNARRVVLTPGRWHLWDLLEISGEIAVDTRAEPVPLADEDRLEAADSYTEGSASDVSALVLYRDGVPYKTLPAGRYRVFKDSPWRLVPVATTVRALDVAHQDLLTKDQVALRVKPLVGVRVTDPLRFVASHTPDDQAYAAVQLALREVIAARELDSLLSDREALSTELAARAAAHLPAVGLAFERVSVKDLTLPGDVKELLAKVVGARKEAEAQAIRRREEVATTRQMLNTARLLQGNPVLLRLKELEALADIATRTKNLTIVAGPDALAKYAMPAGPAADDTPAE